MDTKKLVYIDNVTKKPIFYTENTVFVIYLKSYYHKKRPLRYYQNNELSDALKFFYDLEIPSDYTKYFFKIEKDQLGESDGEKIYLMKGFLPKVKDGVNVNAVEGKGYSYKKVIGVNLSQTPETMQKKLNGIDLKKLPAIRERWTRTKIVYCLLAYYLHLEEGEAKDNLLKIGYKKWMLEKLESGGRDQAAKEYSRVVVESEPDLSDIIPTNKDTEDYLL